MSTSPALALRDALRRRDEPLGRFDLRPLWRGQSFERTVGLPMTVRRARALSAVLSQMRLIVREQDLIVGAPAGVLADALPPGIDQAAYAHYASIDQQIGERSFTTSFDHIAVDYDKLLRVGLPGLLEEAQASMRAHAGQPERVDFLESAAFALRAVMDLAVRWGQVCVDQARSCAFESCGRLLKIGADLQAIARGAPRTFSQALQLVWLVHVVFNIEGRGAMAFGRLDQYLYPFYRDALARGEGAQARALLECMWAKLEEPLLLNPVQNICLGGQTPDGSDAVNELSYLLLEVTRAVATPNSNLSARFFRGTPQRFYDACIGLIKTGIGFPALFNDETLVPALESLGIPTADARDYAFVGCIETFLPGKMPPWSDSRVNLLAAVDRALRNGRDGLSGKLAGVETGDPRRLPSFEAFFTAFAQQVERIVDEHCAQICAAKRALEPSLYTSPLLSALTADCLQRGLDINAGGARYLDFHGPAGMGLGSTSDALAAIRWFLYDQCTLTWEELLAALDANFEGYEPLRQRLLNEAPKYGNGDPYVDQIAARIVQVFTSAVLAHRTPTGGRFVPLMAANISNIYAGQEVGATPDGRLALEPMSDAASPTFGRDRHGPTAVIESLSRVDYRPVVGGTVVNIKFSPSTLAGEEGTGVLRALVQTYFARGGMQLQCNVTGRRLLEEALRHPEAHRDLVVRVSGFSALYVALDRAVQEDILARTEH